MSWQVVVPTNRPQRFAEFLKAWTPLFEKHDVTLHVVQDLPATDETIRRAIDRSFDVRLYSWRDIDQFTPTRADMIRSFGFLKAYESGSDYMLTLDDDVMPQGDLFACYEATFERGAPCSPYFDVGLLTTFDGQMRGFPYRDREIRTVAVQYGGWTGVLDYDAPTQLAGVNPNESWVRLPFHLPRGCAVTGCIMNAAWRTEHTPIMWQLPLHGGLYNRFGDIWSGLFAKKTLDHIGEVMVVNGEACVRHERASDPVTNLTREAPGIPVNEGLWDALEAGGDDLLDAYQSVTDSALRYFEMHDRKYAQHFRLCRDAWLRHFV